jgi:hypothetical protein
LEVSGAAPTVPSVNDLNSFIVAMHSAMDTIRDCPTLVQPTLKAIAQSIQMLVNQVGFFFLHNVCFSSFF